MTNLEDELNKLGYIIIRDTRHDGITIVSNRSNDSLLISGEKLNELGSPENILEYIKNTLNIK